MKTESFYNAYGNPANNPDGYCSVEFTYNAKQQIVKEERSSANQMPKYRWNVRESTYSRQGRILSIAYYYDDNLWGHTGVVDSSQGCSVEKYSYTDNNNGWIVRYYQSDGITQMLNPVIGSAGVQFSVNSHGIIERILYLDTDDRPMFNTVTECIEKSFEYNEQGQLICTLLRVSIGKDENTVDYKRVYYDDLGRETGYDWLNNQMELVRLPEEGYASVRWTYIDSPATQVCTYYDEQMQPTQNLKSMIVKHVINYDQAGYCHGWH